MQSNRYLDMREYLNPRRLTMVMWDYSVFTRHMPGKACMDFDRILDETVERGYNTIRIDPMPQAVDLENPSKIISHLLITTVSPISKTGKMPNGTSG